LVSPWRGKFLKLKNNEFRKDGIDLHQRELITVSAKRTVTLKIGDRRIRYRSSDFRYAMMSPT
jgi:hypothetical protein